MNVARRFDLHLLCFCIGLMGCKTADVPPVQDSASQAPTPSTPSTLSALASCNQAFLEGRRYFHNQNTSSPMDVSSYEAARSMFSEASVLCRGFEFEESALYHLALTHFLTGSYSESSRYYQMVADRFPNGSYNADNFARAEAAFIAECSQDPEHMEQFRYGVLYSLAQMHDEALKHYTLAADSGCAPLVERSRKMISKIVDS